MKRIPAPIIPDKYKDLPDAHILDSNSVAWIFNTERSSVSKLVKLKRIPAPYGSEKCDGTRRNLWLLGSIREFIKSQKNNIIGT